MTYLDTVLVLNIIISLHHNKLDVFWLQTTKYVVILQQDDIHTCR